MNTTSSSISSHAKPTTLPVEQLEADRIKASADTDLSFTEVKPIQTDFHFFVKEVREKLRVQAEQEVRSSIQKDPIASDAAAAADDDDAYLINTNLNARLMKAWEDLSSIQRESYGKKEEVDRRRFMEEDEIASRHCATLTARVRSPAEPGLSNRHKGKNKKNERGGTMMVGGEDPAEGGMHHEDRDLEEREEDPPHLTSDGGDIYTSENRLQHSGDDGDRPEQDPNKGADQVQVKDTTTAAGNKEYEDEEEKTEKARSSPHKDIKRSPPLPEVDEADASPTKKNRVDNESVSVEAV